jgi:hypothetical protein
VQYRVRDHQVQRFQNADASSPLSGELVAKTLLRLVTAIVLGAILLPWWLCLAPAGTQWCMHVKTRHIFCDDVGQASPCKHVYGICYELKASHIIGDAQEKQATSRALQTSLHPHHCMLGAEFRVLLRCCCCILLIICLGMFAGLVGRVISDMQAKKVQKMSVIGTWKVRALLQHAASCHHLTAVVKFCLL